MKFTFSWLKTLLDTDKDLATITDKLTMIGIEVESVENIGEALADFRIARIDEAKPHPNSKKLSICTVSAGDVGDGIDGPRQIICGAPNVREGLISVLAPLGSVIPTNGMKIGKAKLAGEASFGMLCSLSELGLGDDHDGIMELPEDAPIGESYAEYAGLNDPVIEIKVTPNRGDALSLLGIARDLAAAGMGKLKPIDSHFDFDIDPIEGTFESPIKWHIEGENACQFVRGRTFRNVKNGPSPPWLQRFLTLTGHRSISKLVDITNFLTFYIGRPLHVFNADYLSGNQMTMRLAQQNEEILALDGETYRLDKDMTVIADEKGAQSIAGISGGQNSGCDDETVTVFLEAALFDPVAISSAGRKLNLHSDARYRFERGIDPNSEDWGFDFATRLILELCGGECSTITHAGTLPEPAKAISLNPKRLASYGGQSLEAETCIDILQKLGFKVMLDNNLLQATPPSWRPDIEFEACLIEEILRIHGYDEIEAKALPHPEENQRPHLSKQLTIKQKSVKSLASSGLNEIVSWSFLSDKDLTLFDGYNPRCLIANPISSDLNVMRPYLMPNLLTALKRNLARGHGHLSLFEVGPIYKDITPDQQFLHACAIRMGLKEKMRHWQSVKEFDLYDAKADLWQLLDHLNIDVSLIQIDREVKSWFHPGRAGRVLIDGKELGFFGELHPTITKFYDLKAPVVGFEMNLDNLSDKMFKQVDTTLHLPNLQPLKRDFAFLIDADMPADNLVKSIMKSGVNYLTHLHIFDIYQDEALGNKKSVALEANFQPLDKSLKDDEITGLCNRLIKLAEKHCGAQLRQ